MSCRGDQLEVYPDNSSNPTHAPIDAQRLQSWTDFKSNWGAGKNWNATIGSFNTFSYGLHRVLAHRLRMSHLRTRDINEATIKFIPYDFN